MIEPTDEEVEKTNREYEEKHALRCLTTAERLRIKKSTRKNIQAYCR